MKKKNKLFLIVTICMTVICAIKMVGVATGLVEFCLGIFSGMIAFIMGFLFFGIMNLVIAVFYKLLFGNTNIYKWFKKLFHIWIISMFVIWFLGASIFCLATWVSNSAVYFFPQCLLSGAFVGTWVYKNLLEEKVVDNFKINK